MSAFVPQRRTTLRAVATAAAVAAAVLGPAAGAFAATDGPATTVTKDAPEAGGAPGKPAPASEPAPADRPKPADQPAPAEKPRPADKPASTGENAQAGKSTDGRKPAGSKKLPDGSTVKIYKLGAQHYEAEVFAPSKAEPVRRMAADGTDQTITYMDLRVTLHHRDGDLTWMDAADDIRPPAMGRYVRTAQLTGGLSARIYQVGPDSYQAKVYNGRSPVVMIEADGRSAVGSDDGVYFVLNPDGTVVSWVDRGKHVGGAHEQKLPDGNIVAVGKDSPSTYRGEIAVNGRLVAILTAGSRSDVVRYHGMYVVLNPDGSVVAHAPGGKPGGGQEGKPKGGTPAGDTGSQNLSTQKLDAQNLSTRTAQTKAVPQGAVAAGAETAAGDETVLPALGGAFAAAGAAGLGFAVLRRRRPAGTRR
ncbi:hypothetical protein [Streptomyces sp. NPDC052496]|uniref:hypothetical protein n=1 Tax=Streptomyces sp. NPDC052496 TaxID=3154951 RepID=UPI0034376C56